ncbi:MAG: hypothetical protein WCO35_03710 [Candidatus Nomurabacteria bacterium]
MELNHLQKRYIKKGASELQEALGCGVLLLAFVSCGMYSIISIILNCIDKKYEYLLDLGGNDSSIIVATVIFFGILLILGGTLGYFIGYKIAKYKVIKRFCKIPVVK